MSPAARKFEHSLNLPTISSALLVDKKVSANSIPEFSRLSIVHNARTSKSLFSDWMEFTHILGNGILAEIS